MRLLAVISKLTGVSTHVEASEITLNAPSIVKLSAERSDISQLARVNQDLVITFTSGEKLTVKNFYVANDQGASQLVLEDSHGALWWVENPESGLHFEHISTIDDLLVTAGESHEGGAIWPWVLGGAVAAGGIAAIASSGGGGSHHHDNDNGNPGEGSGDGGGNNGGGDNGGGDNGTNPPGGENPTPPTAPVITGATDAVSAITGAIQENQTTNDSQPMITGTGEAGSLITLYDNGQEIGTVMVDEQGNWSYKPDLPLSEGEHVLTATATDENGNTSAISGDFTFTVDTIAPDEVSGLTVSEDGLWVSGIAEAGCVVTIFDSQHNVLASVQVDDTGRFTVRLNSAQTDSEQLYADISDAAGNEGDEATFLGSNSGFPDAPTITGIIDDTQPTAVTLGNGQFTKDTTPTLTGTALPGAEVIIYENGIAIGTASANDGTWVFELSGVSEGLHHYTATQSTEDGVSGNAVEFSVTVDTTPPAAPDELLISQNGTVLTGSTEAGSKVTIADASGATLGTVTADSEGKFSFPLNPPRVNGEVLTATATDKAGNDSSPANATAPDTTPPQAADNLDVSDDGTTVTGTAEPGTTVTIYGSDNAPLGSEQVQPDGSFTVTLNPPQTNGEILTAIVKDPANLTSPPATTLAPDTTPPQPAGNLDVSDDGTTVTGTAEPGSTVTIRDPDGNPIGHGQTDGEGNFTVTLDTPQTNGETLTATVTDPANQNSTPANVTAPDTTAPQPPTAVISADGTTLTATAEPGSTITIKDSDGNTLAETGPIPENGTLVITLDPPQANGETLNVTATDAANNTSLPYEVVAPDITAPEAPVVSSIVDDVGAQKGNLGDGQLTDDNQLTFSGTGEPGAIITILDGGTPLAGTATVDSNGNWTLTTPVLGDGDHTFTVTATDAENQTSTPSASITITVDTTPPVIPVVTLTDNTGSNVGELTDNDVTDATQPVLSGSGTAGDTITVYDGTAIIGTTKVAENGSWSFTPTPALGEGDHTLSVTASDPLGNTSDKSTPITITVDTTAPDIPALTLTNGANDPLTDGQATQETQPVLSGTGTDGDIISIYDNGDLVTTVTVTNGAWSYTSDALDEGDHVFTLTSTDPAGNVSEPSAPIGILVDTTPPAVPNLTVTDNVGSQTG
ncbi:TPA: BapA prefix-like domain-containing protein, partial [Citrobacter amalonaticus]|nr:BapA prefix-like domain-containing protein [Citrobacter amalonaticus]